MTTNVEALRAALKMLPRMKRMLISAKEGHFTREEHETLIAALEASLSTEDGFVRGLEAAAHKVEIYAAPGSSAAPELVFVCQQLSRHIRALSPAPASNGEAVVERVARALAVASRDYYYEATGRLSGGYMTMARAALSAINEKEGE